jgi:23S rRNA (guanosine2251-2'-O)-methyltransferase
LSGEWLYGRQSVRETLRASRRSVTRLYVAEGSQERDTLADIIALCRQRHIPVDWKPKQFLERISANHQGVALETESYPYSSMSEILEACEAPNANPLLLLLDLIQDPQNLGSLLRTAETAGVDGVIMPMHHAAGITPAVVNASSGATEHLKIARSNLAQAIEELKRRNVWVAGLDMGPEAQSAFDADLSIPLALVVGSEGEGLRLLVRRSCDLLLRLPIQGKVESLNAAAAGSVVLYLALRARTKGKESSRR